MLDAPDKKVVAKAAVSAVALVALTVLGLAVMLPGCLVSGCCHAPVNPSVPAVGSSNGIPNLRLVEPGVWRSGQPDAAGWVWLRSVGVSNVIKLNTWDEGAGDSTARAIGMTVHEHPISTIQQLVTGPDPEDIATAVSEIKPGSVVHCQAGRDRSGLVIGLYRLTEGTNKAAAWQEMKAGGFHEALQGLTHFWERQ